MGKKRINNQNNMKDICLIPCFNRPEMLYWTLKQIEKATLANKLEYWFLADHGYNEDVIKVIKGFKYDYKIIEQTQHHNHPDTKLSRNILTGYQRAYKSKAKYVFLIEDDILIGKDFFKMHYAIQEKENVFCSIMSENHNTKYNTNNNINSYYTSQNADYQSIGVCFNRINLKHIIKHLISDYLNNPLKYIKKHYPKSKIGSSYVEQAGLIRRIIEQNKYKVAFPHVARCYHAGFYGKNRGAPIKGHYKEKIDALGKIIFNQDNMQYVTGGGKHYEDSKPIDLNLNCKDVIKEQVKIKKEPKNKYMFTVIMASYLGQYKDCATNREVKFIRAIESLFSQKYMNWELIIISDGCDKTVELYKQHYAGYNNISCYQIDKQQLWSGAVRHAGILKAKGKYIIYLDTDDYYGSEHLKKVKSKLKEYDWVYYNDIDISSGTPKIKYAKLKCGFATTSSICHKRSLNVGWLDLGSYQHDIQFILRLKEKTSNYAFVEECDYHICHWAHSKVEF